MQKVRIFRETVLPYVREHRVEVIAATLAAAAVLFTIAKKESAGEQSETDIVEIPDDMTIDRVQRHAGMLAVAYKVKDQAPAIMETPAEVQ